MDGTKMKLLHVDSSATGSQSVSRLLSAEIVARLKKHDSDLLLTYRDLAANPLPHFTLSPIAAALDEAVLAEYIAADIVVLGAPLYNFGVPSALKAWIDRILIAGRTFRYGPNGIPVGLVPDKRIIIALARGGIYSKGSPMEFWEHGEAYLRTAFKFIGIHECETVIAEGVAISPEHRELAISGARQSIANVPLAGQRLGI